MDVASFHVQVADETLRDLRERLRLTRWIDFGCGGHFILLEEPQLVAESLRVFQSFPLEGDRKI
jgi:pimeloyl-ACP methyl ester carboxylesterase